MPPTETVSNLRSWRRLPDCKQTVKIISSSLDAKLSWSEWLMMKIHLLSCPPCLNFLKQIKFIHSALSHNDGRQAEADTSVKLSDEARERLKNALESQNLP